MAKTYTSDELLSMPDTNPRLFQQLAREHGMSVKTDSVTDILNAILTDGVNFVVDPAHSWYERLPAQGAYTVTYMFDDRGVCDTKTNTFRTVNAAERFCQRIDRLVPGYIEITDLNY